MSVRNYKHVAIGVCDRCKCKKPITSLTKDGNSPGLRVCSDDVGCWDQLDPYRKPRKRERPVTLKYTRPDIGLDTGNVIIEAENGSDVVTQDGYFIRREPS